MVGFYGMSTSIGYSILNPVYILNHIYIKYILFLNSLLITFLNAYELIFAHSWMVSSISIKHEQFYLLLIIYPHTVKCFNLLPITKTIQFRRARHTGHCWRSKDELISDVLLWTPAYGQAKAGRPARTYIQQLREDTECSPEELPKAMNDWEKWQERVRDIRASGTTWWWCITNN